MSFKTFPKSYCIFILFISNLFAGSTGKLTGSIKDEAGNPLLGVNIYLDGFSMGTSSDVNGKYMIINIPAASYTVVITYVGYQTIKTKGVIINADHTTQLDFHMEISALVGDEVTVIASKPVIVKDQTATTKTMESATIRNMPVNNVAGVLSTMAGVMQNHSGNYIVDGGYHFRGGRSGEITYLVDGFVMEDALYGDMGLDISRNAISEISMITGAFNAEYGEATSGVINIVTKEGQADYSWEYGQVSDVYLNPGIHGQNLNRFEGMLSGPLLPFNTHFATIFFNADYTQSKTALWKTQLPFNILKYDANGNGIYEQDDGDEIALADLSADGIDNPVELRKGTMEVNDVFDYAMRINTKLVFRPLQKLKLVTALNYFDAQRKDFSMDWRPIQEMNSTRFEKSGDFQVKASYAVSEKMFFDLRYQRYTRQEMSGYKPNLNNKNHLYMKIYNLPEYWSGYIPPALEGENEYLWLSYYAEPFKDLNGDGEWNLFSAEFWRDDNQNGVWDNNESFSDWNEDGIWNMIDEDENGLPDEEPYSDLDGNEQYTFGVNPPSNGANTYDGTANQWFWSDYPILNNFGDTARVVRSTYNNYSWYHADYTTLGGSFTWQFNDKHQIKTGFESRNYDVGEFSAFGIGGGFFGNSSDPSFIMWNHQPKSQNAYLQDKVEYNDVVINVGLRYDRLDPNSSYPDPTKELGYQYTDAGGNANIIESNELGNLSADEKETLHWGYLVRDNDGQIMNFNPAPKAPVKDRWSPRFGIGYPITDRTAFHFSYGQFYQFPDLSFMYNYSNDKGNSGNPPGWSDKANDLAQNQLFGNPYYPFPYNITDWHIPEVGTPNVSPQRSVQYETGIRTHIGNRFVLTFNLYYKDMFDYIASKRYDADPSQFAIYENMDYANSRGIEMTFQQLYSHGLDWEINYTLSRAEGNAPTESYHWYVAEWANGYDWRNFNHTYTMPWDQTHTINFRLNYNHKSGAGLSIVGYYGSGLPYTPEDARARPVDEQYSGRMDSNTNFDLKLFYDRSLKDYDFRIFADVSNVFNTENVLAVDNTTGEPFATLDSGQPLMYVWKPYNVSPPRHIELGISISH